MNPDEIAAIVHKWRDHPVREDIVRLIGEWDEEVEGLRHEVTAAEAALAKAREALQECLPWLEYAYGNVSSVTADKVKAYLPNIRAQLKE